ncbi:hypothetical protein ACWDYH_17230 [Nocardia goodfellowii]
MESSTTEPGVEPEGVADGADVSDTKHAEAAAGAKMSTPQRWKRAATAFRGRGGAGTASKILSVAAVGVAAALAVVVAVDDTDAELTTLRARLATDAEAERIASNYAQKVSAVDFAALEKWRGALQENVSPELQSKLGAAVDVVGPWLAQMEYSSTAKVLAAKVSERQGDHFVVQVFVDMNSKSRQTPSGVTATAAYVVTLDRGSGWTITDVGGVGPDLVGPPAPQPLTTQAPR